MFAVIKTCSGQCCLVSRWRRNHSFPPGCVFACRQQVLCQSIPKTFFPLSSCSPSFSFFPSLFGLYSSNFPSAVIFPPLICSYPSFAAKPCKSRGPCQQRCNCSLAIKGLLMPCSQSHGNAANASSNASAKLDPFSSLSFEELLCGGLLMNTVLRLRACSLICFAFLYHSLDSERKLMLQRREPRMELHLSLESEMRWFPWRADLSHPLSYAENLLCLDLICTLQVTQVTPKDYGVCVCVCVCVCLVAQSCPTLCDPMDCSLPDSSAHGCPRQEYWSGIFLTQGWSQHLLCLLHSRWILYCWATGKPLHLSLKSMNFLMWNLWILIRFVTSDFCVLNVLSWSAVKRSE